MAWINPIIGRAPSSPEILAQLEQNCELTVRAVEKEITGKKFLVGETLTIADLFVISGLARGYQFVRPETLVTLYFIKGQTNRPQGFHQELGCKASHST